MICTIAMSSMDPISRWVPDVMPEDIEVFLIINKGVTFSRFSSTSDTIRYLSLHDNKYLRYFSGHTKT